MINGERNIIYEFNGYRLDPTERRLFHDGALVQLPPKVFEILVMLVENSGHLVEKENLMERVWADSFVEEGNLKNCIHTLRKILHGADFIETVPKKGYRLNTPVKLIEKTAGNFLIEKQTISSITVESTEIDEAENQLSLSSGHLVTIISRPKVYLSILLVLILLAGEVYYSSDRQTKTNASINPLAKIKTIAVLPLKSLSDPPSDKELRIGMADSIITRLSSIKELAVRPTSATVRYLDQNYDTTEVGKELRVDSVLEGSMQKEGQKLKINLQMVSVSDGKLLWADSFSNNLSDILSGQESVANRVSRQMAMSFNTASPENKVQSLSDSTAQKLYLKGQWPVVSGR